MLVVRDAMLKLFFLSFELLAQLIVLVRLKSHMFAGQPGRGVWPGGGWQVFPSLSSTGPTQNGLWQDLKRGLLCLCQPTGVDTQCHAQGEHTFWRGF